MNKRLVEAAILATIALLISPVFAQASRTTHLASATLSSPTIVESPTAVRNSLRYFRFNAGQCRPAATVPRETGGDSAAASITMPDIRATGEAVRRRAGDAGAIFADTLRRIQSFGGWCRNTGLKVANLYNAIADSCRSLQRATAAFSKSEAQAAVLPTPAPPATSQAAIAGNYRYLWENERGDRIYSLDPKFDPNHGGLPVWHRIK